MTPEDRATFRNGLMVLNGIKAEVVRLLNLALKDSPNDEVKRRINRSITLLEEIPAIKRPLELIINKLAGQKEM